MKTELNTQKSKNSSGFEGSESKRESADFLNTLLVNTKFTFLSPVDTERSPLHKHMKTKKGEVPVSQHFNQMFKAQFKWSPRESFLNLGPTSMFRQSKTKNFNFSVIEQPPLKAKKVVRQSVTIPGTVPSGGTHKMRKTTNTFAICTKPT